MCYNKHIQRGLMKRCVVLLSFLLVFFTSCNSTDSGRVTIINTTSNVVEVLFIEPFNVQELSIPANSSIEKEWTNYVKVEPVKSEKYVYVKEFGDTFILYTKEIKQMVVYVTNTTGMDQTIENIIDPTSGEFPVLQDAKNIKLEMLYIIGFELAVKKTETSGDFVIDYRKEKVGEELRNFYLIRSPGY